MATGLQNIKHNAFVFIPNYSVHAELKLIVMRNRSGKNHQNSGINNLSRQEKLLQQPGFIIPSIAKSTVTLHHQLQDTCRNLGTKITISFFGSTKENS